MRGPWEEHIAGELRLEVAPPSIKRSLSGARVLEEEIK
jgi:hypothetical protein